MLESDCLPWLPIVVVIDIVKSMAMNSVGGGHSNNKERVRESERET